MGNQNNSLKGPLIIGALIVGIISLFVFFMIPADDCPSAPLSKAQLEKPKGIHIFIDNSASMAPFMYRNTKMKQQLFNNVITGLDPLAISWDAPIKCFLVANKVVEIPIDTLKEVIGSKAAIIKRFNGQGTPLDLHFSNALAATKEDEIGILVTDGIMCATTEDITKFKKDTGRETFTKENLSNYAASVKRVVSDRYKGSSDFVFKVYYGYTDVEFSADMPYYNYKNVPISGLNYKLFPYYYFVWGPVNAVHNMVDELNRTAGFLADLNEIELNVARIKGNEIEPVYGCEDLARCGGAEWSLIDHDNILNITRQGQDSLAFFIRS